MQNSKVRRNQAFKEFQKHFTHNTSAWALTMPHCYPFMIQIAWGINKDHTLFFYEF